MKPSRALSQTTALPLFELTAQIMNGEPSVTLTPSHAAPEKPAQGGRARALSAPAVSRTVRAILDGSRSNAEARQRWLQSVATRVTNARPDLASALVGFLSVNPDGPDHLAGLSIGEVGVCYEAILSELDRHSRKSSGQFFTPDDAAAFMALQSDRFDPSGVWLDPCSGVGNLAWHLASRQHDPGLFVRNQLVLIDRDRTALKTAVALIAADFMAPDDLEGCELLAGRAHVRDFLSPARLPHHDFVIVNPPYARAEGRAGFETSATRDLFAYFIEKVAKQARGFIAVTPASFLSAPKYAPLRNLLDRSSSGGEVHVFDNVPDTLFRGYKYGSNNTSKTNFVRAAITSCAPSDARWRTTPILRWQVADRDRMFEQCSGLLTDRTVGPGGEWAKVHPELQAVWRALLAERMTIADLIVDRATEYRLEVGLTPRYYISATYRILDRGSKATLYFPTAESRDKAALVLNSRLAYLWWRALDGGVTLPRRVLMSTPVPGGLEVDAELILRLQASETVNLVSKLNAGRENENVRHPEELIQKIDGVVLPGSPNLAFLTVSSMFGA